MRKPSFTLAALICVTAYLAIFGTAAKAADGRCRSDPVELTGKIELFDGRIGNTPGGARQKVVVLVTNGVLVPDLQAGRCVSATRIHLYPVDVVAELALRRAFDTNVTVSAQSIARATEGWQRGDAIARGVRLKTVP